MGAWSVTEEVLAAVETHLATDIQTVATARSVMLDSTFAVFPRERAETFAGKVTGAGVGVWVESARTGAYSQGKRDWSVVAVIDYSFRGGNRNEVALQVELVTEALMAVVDRLPTTGSLMLASEDPRGTRVIQDISERVQEAAGKVAKLTPVVAAARVRIPITQRDEI